jgi:hypothetical protein
MVKESLIGNLSLECSAVPRKLARFRGTKLLVTDIIFLNFYTSSLIIIIIIIIY